MSKDLEDTLTKLQNAINNRQINIDNVYDLLQEVLKGVTSLQKTTDDALRGFQFESFMTAAQVKINALEWAIKKSKAIAEPDALQAAIKFEVQTAKNAMRFRQRENLPELARFMVTHSTDMTKAFDLWLEEGQRELVESNFDNDLVPYVKKIVKEIPHVKNALLTEDSALSDFCPVEVDMDSFIQHMSKKLNIPIMRGQTLLKDLAMHLKNRYEGD